MKARREIIATVAVATANDHRRFPAPTRKRRQTTANWPRRDMHHRLAPASPAGR